MKKLMAILTICSISSQCFAMIGSHVHCISKDNSVAIDIDSDAQTLAVNYGARQDPGAPATVIDYGVKLYANSNTGLVVNIYQHGNQLDGTLEVNHGGPTPLTCENL